MKYIPGLNGVRALAVIAVVWHHTHTPIDGYPLTGNGFLGVDVFFVLSGFLITALLLEERSQFGDVSLRAFYIRRSLRIFPLYYLVLAVLAAYFVLKGSNQRLAYFDELPAHLAYVSNWVPVASLMAITWSLSTEEQFYLAWPPVVAWAGRWAIWVLLLFLALNQVVNFRLIDSWLTQVGMPRESLSILQTTFTPIILGSLLAYLLRSGMRQRVATWVAGPRLFLLGLLLVGVASYPGDMQGAPRLAFHLLSTFVLAGIVLHPDSALSRVLEWRPLAYVGAISYGIYLLHKLVLDAVVRALLAAHVDPAVWTFWTCLAGTIAIAAVSHRFFETPLLRLKGVLAKGRVRTPRPIAGARVRPPMPP